MNRHFIPFNPIHHSADSFPNRCPSAIRISPPPGDGGASQPHLISSPNYHRHNHLYAVLSVCPASRSFSSSLPNFRTRVSQISSPFLVSKSTGSLLACERARFCSFRAAAVSDTTAAMSESAQEHNLSAEKPNPIGKENDENQQNGDVASELLDDSKMIRICDKLIGVFMVEKPTPTDWRRLLMFSKEWDDIRPHFYARCQERADSESDPGMMHKLLRLARKLKELHGATPKSCCSRRMCPCSS